MSVYATYRVVLDSSTGAQGRRPHQGRAIVAARVLKPCQGSDKGAQKGYLWK